MSVIDYIFVSESLYNSIIDVCVQDSGLNFSDHVPIIACFKGNFEAKCNSDKSNVKEKNVVKSLRWDKADLSKYYSYTYLQVYPIYQELCYVSDALNVSNYVEVIHDLYRRLIAALLNSDFIIPRVSPTLFKHWWNSSLDECKLKSIESYKLWAAVGKPADGFIYSNMIRSKSAYKHEIDKCKGMSEKI